MKEILTPGGWEWWCRQIKAAHPEAKLDYPALMQKYIKGTKWEDAL